MIILAAIATPLIVLYVIAKICEHQDIKRR